MTALQKKEYKYGFVSDVASESLPKGLNEGIIEQISAKKKGAFLGFRFALKSL